MLLDTRYDTVYCRQCHSALASERRGVGPGEKCNEKGRTRDVPSAVQTAQCKRKLDSNTERDGAERIMKRTVHKTIDCVCRQAV